MLILKRIALQKQPQKYRDITASNKRRFRLLSPIKKYKSMTIYKKLSISFLLIAFFSSFVIGAVGVLNLNSSNAISERIYSENLVPLSPLYRIQTDYLTMGTKINANDIFGSQNAISDLSFKILNELSEYSMTVKDENEKAVLKQMTSDITDYQIQMREVLNDFQNNNSKAAYELMKNDISKTSEHFDGLITSLFSQKIAEAKQRNEQSQKNFTLSMGLMALVMLVSIILAAFFGKLNAKLICKPITGLIKTADEISEGNLNVTIDKGSGDEISTLANAFEKMTNAWSGYIKDISTVLSQMSEGNLDVEISSEYKGDFIKIKESINHIASTLNDVIGQIIIASNEVAASSKQLSAGSQSLSAGASEQAASVEQLTASIAEIAQKTNENASSASKADKIANSVKTDTDGGNEKMERMLVSMNEISESSAGISKIIKVINDIAFQTNILALNASIEAARAGSYGRGFAVVAEEVRHLAQRSSEAAKDTTQMIDKSLDKAAEGTDIARDTSAALKKIEEGVNGTASILNEIARSSNEQAVGISQLNKGIDEVSKIVQINSATAEQSAAASEELFREAETMRQLVSRFQVRQM